MPKYTVEYWEHILHFRDIEADSPEEALALAVAAFSAIV